MEEMLIGVTDRTILVYIPDPASTDGSGKTGLAHTDMTVSYTRVETDNDVVNTDVTSSLNALTNLTDAHNDWGWKEVSNTLAPGLYRLDVADALFATGAWYAALYVMITSSAAAATPKIFRLVAVNALDGVRGGMTALPNANADAAGGLIISDAGGLDADAQLVTKINDILTDTGTTLDGRIPAALVGGRMDANVGAISSDATAADNAESFFDGTGYAGTGNTIPTVTNLTNKGDGSGFTAIPWNAAWDAEAQSEAADAITAALNDIADAVLKRNASNVEGTAGEHTLCTVILAMLENSISGTTLTIKRTDGSTTHATKTLTTNASADPITGIT